MGQWNTDSRSKETLPTPITAPQKLIHFADYLASRKDIDVSFDESVAPKPVEKPTLETYRIPFGKHAGKTLPEIAAIDKGYIDWAKKNMEKEPVKTLLMAM